MGGSALDDDWEFTVDPSSFTTVVLLGRTGNGKSATGNSILGKKEFKSRASSTGITSTCELQRTVLRDGRIVNVIDTPGLFDFSAGSDFIGKEIVNCINLAKDGIHAILVVFSVRTRFSKEEEAALQSLQRFFGERITDYMIIVFTGGDELEENEETLDDYLGRECPKPLQNVIQACDNRIVLFDNKSKDERKRMQQLHQLLSIVDAVVAKNNGQPYSDEIFAELKERTLKFQSNEKQVLSLEGYSKREISDLRELMNKTYNENLRRITEMVETRLRETTQRLEKQLADELVARMEAEKSAKEAQMKSSDEIRKLRESLEKARWETEELRMETEELRKHAESGKCAIL